MGEDHRVVKKNFRTDLWVDGKELPLNNMMQETLANILAGYTKTLKGIDSVPESIEVKVKRLHQPVEVDAHTYP